MQSWSLSTCTLDVWAVSTSMSRTLPARLRRRARARRTRRSLRLESRCNAWAAASKRRVWVRRSWTWSGVGRLGDFFISLDNLRMDFWMRFGSRDIGFPCSELDAAGLGGIARPNQSFCAKTQWKTARLRGLRLALQDWTTDLLCQDSCCS